MREEHGRIEEVSPREGEGIELLLGEAAEVCGGLPSPKEEELSRSADAEQDKNTPSMYCTAADTDALLLSEVVKTNDAASDRPPLYILKLNPALDVVDIRRTGMSYILHAERVEPLLQEDRTYMIRPRLLLRAQGLTSPFAGRDLGFDISPSREPRREHLTAERLPVQSASHASGRASSQNGSSTRALNNRTTPAR